MPSPLLAEQFEDLPKQEHAGRLAMWIFLGSEAMLFGALITLYAAYRVMYGAEFVDAVKHNDLLIGTLNTYILITSSFTVALSIQAVRRSLHRVAAFLLLASIVLGCGFLALKSLEYSEHFHDGIFPGYFYRDPELATHAAKMFFTLYYLATALHALHVAIGIGVLAWAMAKTWRGGFSPEHHLGLELAGLYWHLVDVVWIFLWPLLYLTR